MKERRGQEEDIRMSKTMTQAPRTDTNDLQRGGEGLETIEEGKVKMRDSGTHQAWTKAHTSAGLALSSRMCHLSAQEASTNTDGARPTPFSLEDQRLPSPCLHQQ